jgi:TPR repeat protein
MNFCSLCACLFVPACVLVRRRAPARMHACVRVLQGVGKDDALAIELWTKAAKQDNQDAQFILGWKDGAAEDAAED